MNAAPDAKKDWPLLTAIAALLLLFSFGVRSAELPGWDNPLLRVAGERIMSTHDAYFWLAGAEGIGAAADSPMAFLARAGAKLFRVPVATFGFHAPACLAGLVGVAILLWAWSLGALEAGICAGALAAIAPGFYFRTRLGMYDTDLATLFCPLLVGWLLLRWADPRLTPFRWRPSFAPPPPPLRLRSEPAEAAAMLAAGFVARFCAVWHNDIRTFTMLSVALVAILLLLRGAPLRRRADFWGLSFFALAALLGWPGLGLGLALLAAGRVPGLPRVMRSKWTLWALLVVIAVSSGATGATWRHGARLFSLYLKPTTASLSLPSPVPTPGNAVKPRDAHPQDPVRYPGQIQSVTEAQRVPVKRMLFDAHPYPWVALVGGAGLLALMAARPATTLLAPLALLWALSGVFGYRLSMFGGPALFLGLCVPLCWFARAKLRAFRWAPTAMALFFLLAAVVLAAPLAQLYSREILAPVLSQAQAKALLSLRATTPENAMLWTWWDHGYAATYFSRRETFADGGRNEGERLLPLGLALSARSPKQANQLLKFCAAHEYAPWEVWNAQPATKVQAFLESLATKELGLKPGRKNYLIVTIEQLRALSWISFYGAWRVDSGEGERARIVWRPPHAPVDVDQGLLSHSDPAKRVTLASIDFVERTPTPDGRNVATLRRFAYGRASHQHLVLIPSSNDAFLLDKAAYESLLVRLLLFDAYAPDIAPSFKLVYEDGPLVRVYEAL